MFFLFFSPPPRNSSHPSNIQITMCRSPKMGDIVGQVASGRVRPQRTRPIEETRKREVPNTDEEEVDEEEDVSCFKETTLDSAVQLDVSNQQQREVAVVMGVTPSPAPSVISIGSDQTDGEGEEGDGQRCPQRA